MSSISPGGRPQPEAPAALRRLLSHDVLISAAALILAAGLAWAWLVATASADMADDHMAMMTVEPWSAAYLGPAFVMWALMMVAMMLPSAAPMILLRARIDRWETSRERLFNTLLFASSYLLVWAGFSALAALLQAALTGAGLIGAASLRIGDRTIAGMLLLAAAAYQLSGVKAACLDQCRSPVHFVMRYWRPGAAGALRLGTIHGLYCIGCCWVLMLLLFAGGVMNLAWVAVLAIAVSIEKWAPPQWRASYWVAVLLAAAGIALLVTV